MTTVLEKLRTPEGQATIGAAHVALARMDAVCQALADLLAYCDHEAGGQLDMLATLSAVSMGRCMLDAGNQLTGLCAIARGDVIVVERGQG